MTYDLWQEATERVAAWEEALVLAITEARAARELWEAEALRLEAEEVAPRLLIEPELRLMRARITHL